MGAVNSEAKASSVTDTFGLLAAQSLRTFAGKEATPAVPAPVALAFGSQPSCTVASPADFAQAADNSPGDPSFKVPGSSGASASACAGAPSQSDFTLEVVLWVSGPDR